jgi:hypothetical protein
MPWQLVEAIPFLNPSHNPNTRHRLNIRDNPNKPLINRPRLNKHHPRPNQLLKAQDPQKAFQSSVQIAEHLSKVRISALIAVESTYR